MESNGAKLNNTNVNSATNSNTTNNPNQPNQNPNPNQPNESNTNPNTNANMMQNFQNTVEYIQEKYKNVEKQIEVMKEGSSSTYAHNNFFESNMYLQHNQSNYNAPNFFLSPISPDYKPANSSVNYYNLDYDGSNAASGTGNNQMNQIKSNTPNMSNIASNININSSVNNTGNNANTGNTINNISNIINMNTNMNMIPDNGPTDTMTMTQNTSVGVGMNITNTGNTANPGMMQTCQGNPLFPENIQPKLQNIVSTANLKCELELREIALRAKNAEYNPKRFAAVIMRIREPKTTALIFASGKMVCTGARSEEDSKKAARQYAKIINKLGFPVKFSEFKIQNIVGSCDVRFPIRLEGLAMTHARYCSYEPEMFPGLIYRMIKPKIVLLIFVSGKIVLTGAKERSDIFEAFKNIYETLLQFKKKETGSVSTDLSFNNADA